MPGGFTMFYASSNDVTILDYGHNIINDPNPITDAELDGWNSSTHGYLIDLPPGSHPIIAQEPTGEPATAEFGMGLGCVVPTLQTLEWGWDHGYSRILENFILYHCGPPEPPVADFEGTPTVGCAPLTVNFTNQSSGAYDTCFWEFGDGGTSSDCDPPPYTYVSPGVYTVVLTVSGPGGSDTEIKTDYITVEPCVVASLWIEPAYVEVPISGQVTVDVMVAGATDMYGAAVEIHFDPALVEVVDADPGTPGVQITPGTCPSPDFPVQNEANNATGVINYDVISLAPSPPCDNGVVASITFHGLAEGTSPVHFSSWLLADTGGFEIPAAATDGEVHVTAVCLLEGFVDLQGRSDHSGAEFCAHGPGGPFCAWTDPAGYYEVAVPQDTYDLTLEMERYLDSEMAGVFCPAGTTVTLPPITLPGGDANDDDTINILDLSLMGSHYLLNCGDPGWDERADINNDCTVNILDLVLAGGNYLSSSPVPW
jgi:PKD repeat protein